MRLSLPSIAILSLFAASSHAFAPPTFTAASTTSSSRLAANNELSGMLNEYSASAPPPGEVADSAVDSVMKAASGAQDAADQAAAAAAAVASKGVVATKAKAATLAVGTISSGAQLKPLAGAAFVPASIDNAKMPFQVDPSKVNSDNAYDASARAQENLAILKANLFGGAGGIKEGSRVVNTAPHPPQPHMDITLPKFDFDFSASTATVATIIASLHLKEYGGWYVAAAMALIASQQRSAGMEDASMKFETELAVVREKASEAASAAGVAAEGAKTAKNLAMKMDKDMKTDGGRALLESSKSRVALVEKDIMEKEKRALQAEVASLRNQLEKTAGGKKKKGTRRKTVKKTEIEQEYPTKVVMESDDDIDEKIVEMLKLLDEENAIKQTEAAKELEKKRKQEAKLVAAEKKKVESKKMTKGVEASQAKPEVAKKSAVTKKAKKSATKAKRKTVTKSEATKSAAKKAPEAMKPVEKKAPEATKPVEKKAPEATKPVEKKAPEAAKPVEKKAPEAAEPVEKKAPRRAATIDDWASLAESTLKRKTVAQLSEYLTGKGATVTDSAGKSLKKAELLGAVKSL